MDWQYTGNRLHPTQKPVECLTPIVKAFCKPGDVVLDPFCGSGSSLVAARDAGCAYLGIELDASHHRTANERLGLRVHAQIDENDIMPWLQPFTHYVDAA